VLDVQREEAAVTEEDQKALLEWEGEGGSPASTAAARAPETARARPPALDRADDRASDPRNRRGSLGPAPSASPLGETASAAALHAHLVHLLDARHEPAALPRPDTTEPSSLRAEQVLGPHEDLERQPDGVPHAVIGLTALSSVFFAALMISIFRAGPTPGTVAGALLALIAVPWLVFKLGARAERDRDHVHPSR
jgi:hypothetical protein